MGSTALHHTVNKGHTQLIELLLPKGTEVDARDKNGETTLAKYAIETQSRWLRSSQISKLQ